MFQSHYIKQVSVFLIIDYVQSIVSLKTYETQTLILVATGIHYSFLERPKLRIQFIFCHIINVPVSLY